MKFLILILLLFISVIPMTQASGLGDIVNSEFNVVQEGVTGSSTASDLDNIVVDIIQTILGFLGLLFVVLIIWSGFQWMTAGGNTTAIDTAKKRIINAVIGLVIVLAAYSITQFVITKVYRSTTGSGIECSSDSDCASGWTCEEVNGNNKCVF